MQRIVPVLLSFALAGMAAAFSWTPFEFPPGDQGYVLEILSSEGVARIDVDVVARGDLFDVRTTMTLEQSGISPSSVGDAFFGGSALAMFGFGPMVLFGPSAFMLPMMLGDDEIRVRKEPMRIMGVGTLLMDREEVVAGRSCVVITVDMDGGDEIVFAVAEGVPVPCFTRYGSGNGAIEVRLIEVR
jgi:hypothetical protein